MPKSNPLRLDFHSVQNVVRSTFCDRFLLKYKQSITANEICSASQFVFQKKAIAKGRSRMEIRLNTHKNVI